jgi:hypothetical protein
MDKQPTDNAVTRFFSRLPLYTRMGFGGLVVFGMVGNCSGHRQQSVVVLAIVAMIWCCLRILTEAIEAYRILYLAKQHDADQKKPKDNDDNGKSPPPPLAPV